MSFIRTFYPMYPYLFVGLFEAVVVFLSLLLLLYMRLYRTHTYSYTKLGSSRPISVMRIVALFDHLHWANSRIPYSETLCIVHCFNLASLLVSGDSTLYCKRKYSVSSLWRSISLISTSAFLSNSGESLTSGSPVLTSW